MSMSIHGLSDFYGNIPFASGLPTVPFKREAAFLG